MGTKFYHYDGQGSTVCLTDEDANVTDSYAYTAFGESVDTGVENPTTNHFRYLGQQGYYLDTDTEDYYVRARTYQPTIARWLSKDLLGFAAGDVNLYRYVWNDATNFIDPSGLDTGDPRYALGNAPGFPTTRPNTTNGNYLVTWQFLLVGQPKAVPLAVVQEIKFSIHVRTCGRGPASTYDETSSYYELLGFIPAGGTEITLPGVTSIVNGITVPKGNGPVTLPTIGQANTTLNAQTTLTPAEITALQNQITADQTAIQNAQQQLQGLRNQVGSTPTMRRMIAQLNNLINTDLNQIQADTRQLAANSALLGARANVGKNFSDFWSFPGFGSNVCGTITETGQLFVYALTGPVLSSLRNFDGMGNFNVKPGSTLWPLPVPPGQGAGGGLAQSRTNTIKVRPNWTSSVRKIKVIMVCQKNSAPSPSVPTIDDPDALVNIPDTGDN